MLKTYKRRPNNNFRFECARLPENISGTCHAHMEIKVDYY